jgi:hypothetical protein
MNSNPCLFFFYSFAAVLKTFGIVLYELSHFLWRRTGCFLNDDFLVVPDTSTAVFDDRFVLNRTGKAGMFFSLVPMPVATTNRPKQKSR